MKMLLSVLIVLAVGIFLGILIHHDSGYVLLSYQQWTLETSLWVALAALIIFYAFFYFGLQCLACLLGLSARFRLWNTHHRLKKAQYFTQEGLSALAEGRWKKAETHLIKAASDHPTPLINYLAAARAAQEQDNFESRDHYLKLAYEQNPREEIAIGLTQAQLQMNAKQWERALATLQHLQHLKPHHPYTLKLLQIVYKKLGAWHETQQLLPQLRKLHILPDKKLQALEKNICLSELQACPHEAGALNALWQCSSKRLKQDEDVHKAFIRAFLQAKDHVMALTLIEMSLKRTWDSDLVKYLPSLVSDDQTESWLHRAEAWLKTHPHDAALLFCLGKLCERLHLWGKARDYIDGSIAQHAEPEAYYALGHIYEALGDHSKALRSYKLGLQVIVR